MANFKGTAKEFNSFIGPLLRNIICNMTRTFKKHKSCAHIGCGKGDGLEAAHIKGHERPVIIASLLMKYQIDNSELYDVDLVDFEKRFIDYHTPIEDVIKPLCRTHHKEYDKNNDINPEYPLLIDAFEDADGKSLYSDEELDTLEKAENEEIESLIKIGTHVRQIFRELEKKNILTVEDIDRLSHEGYSKETFKLYYPILIEFNDDINIIKDDNGKSRYFIRDKYKFFGKQYLLCSEWYEKNRENLDRWYHNIRL